MKHLKLTNRINGIVVFVFLFLPCLASSQHDVYLQTPNIIPNYCQESSCWCGAAVCQMILEGYPGGIDHSYSQTHIWNRIQAHKNDLGLGWCTDPDGLRETLMELGGDPGVNWVIFDNASAQSLMYTIAYWMTRRQYPTATLVNGFAHWITIVGFTTDVNPVDNSNVNLQFVEIDDPWNPPCPTCTSGGVKSLMSGTNWYSNYWHSAGNYPASKWHGKYVAVVEPPLNEGQAISPSPIEKGQVIPDSVAVSKALMWIKEFHLDEREPYIVLQKTQPLEPLLVNADYKGYFIVPFGFIEQESAQAAILVNAYDGAFQEVGVFQKLIKYLSEERATHLALNYLCYCRAKTKARLVFQPSEQTESRFLPVWEIRAEKRFLLFFKKQSIVYVNQTGKVFENLTSMPLGD